MTFRNRWTEEQIAVIRSLWPSHSGTEIALQFGVSRNVIAGLSHRHCFPPKERTGGKPRLSPEQRRQNKMESDRRSTANRRARLMSDPEYRARRDLMLQAWREKNRDRIRAQKREYAKTHVRVYNKKRDAVRAARGYGGAVGTTYRPYIEAVPVTACRLMDLFPNQCCWPIGEPTNGQLFCGAPKANGSYCTHHHSVAYRCVEARWAA